MRLSSGPPLRAGSIVNENQKRRKVVTWIKKIDLNWRRICHTRSLCADSAMTYRNLVDDKTISNERIRKAIPQLHQGYRLVGLRHRGQQGHQELWGKWVMTFLEIALACVARGWYVHPLKPGDKFPITKHGKNDATLDEGQVREWWTRWPTANVGSLASQAACVCWMQTTG